MAGITDDLLVKAIDKLDEVLKSDDVVVEKSQIQKRTGKPRTGNLDLEDEDEDGESNTDEKGTDYKKSVSADVRKGGKKILKPEDLEELENEGGGGEDDEGKEVEDEDEEKSLEVSIWLKALGAVHAEHLADVDERFGDLMKKSWGDEHALLTQVDEVAGEVSKSLGRADQALKGVESQPARAARGALVGGEVKKSVDEAGADIVLRGVEKMQTATKLRDLALKGLIPDIALTRFESSGVLDSGLQKALRAA